MAKGLDGKFLHYGIRKEDLELILIAGATGSGKSNLLAVLIQQFRNLSTETPYPVNFLLFDYKGEFSDPMNAHWLAYFDIFSVWHNISGALMAKLYASKFAFSSKSILE